MLLHFVEIEDAFFCDRRWACIGLLFLAIIRLLSRLYGYLCAQRFIHQYKCTEPTWCCGAAKVNGCAGIDVAAAVFPPNKGCIVLVREKPAVSRLWGSAQGALPLLCPPTQVFYCSREMCPVAAAGNLSMICRGDCHRVGRSGRSASPHKLWPVTADSFPQPPAPL